MIPMTSWTAEFCTVCDKQCILGSVYCSQACRELDMRKPDDGSDSTGFPSNHSTTFSSHETSESSDEEQVPAISLPKSATNLSSSTTSLSKSVPRPRKREFLYASPVLKPSKGPSVLPNVSPLLIPQSTLEPAEQINAQSVSTYRRWLAGSHH